ncbi:hypothetical protein GCM10027422_38570 [Hymenobacter arcticus]
MVLLESLGVARAQAGVVRGTRQEVGTGQPIPFASVVLLRSADSTFVGGGAGQRSRRV